MAATESSNKPHRVASLDEEIVEVSPGAMGRLGLLNGILVGLSVTIGLWGAQILAIQPLPMTQKYGSIILAGALILVLCGLVGWVTGWLRKTAVSILFWLVNAILITFIASYQPYQIRTFLAWISDTRFWGLDIYPFSSSFTILVFISILLAGIFLMLLFIIAGLFQDSRLAGINQERTENGRLNRQAWTKLLLPLPIFILVGFLTANIIANNSWKTIPIVDQAIKVVRDYDGDLFEIGLNDGIDYAAARGVRDQLVGDYVLSVGAVDADTLSTIIVADFDSGAWINCRFLNEQLNFCYDGSLPYTIGFKSLITGEEIVTEECRGCAVMADEQWANWLRERGAQLGPDPTLTRAGMQGEFVIMQAENPEEGYAVQCWFQGSSPVEILKCEDIN